MAEFKPFENDEQSWTVGSGDGLTIENGSDSISIYGEAKFDSSQNGKNLAAELLKVLRDIQGKIPQGSSGRRLWCKKRLGSLIVGGDVEVSAASGANEALASAIDSLDKFTKEPVLTKVPKS